ncbi:MAG: UDP-3-O-(3-hydroxymyristoyl)glucosamine N-acyltransferase [Acidobacteria bacterium]|nr:UDP-3-O-(3-hydroxymyristoyl)glucosamine N-acyltransferase [Acidobacteriota bacterium]
MTVSVTLGDLGARLGAKIVGDAGIVLRGIRPLDEAGPEHLSFLHNPKYRSQLESSRAGAVIVDDPELAPDRNLLVVEHPYLAHARALEIFYPEELPPPGVHPSAVVDSSACLGEGVSVGPCAVVGPGCSVGDRSVIAPGAVLVRDVAVGVDCRIHSRVVVENGCRIGDRCILHAGVVLGADGFGFATVDGVHHKVPQVGIVVVEDDVEIGANTCIDRAALGETRIGRGTKIDNLVQIAHNVVIGEGSLIVAQTGISGSTRLGHHVVMGGQVGTVGHIRIGDGAIIGAKGGVIKDVPDGAFIAGFPTQPYQEWVRSMAQVRNLWKLRRRLTEMEKMLERLRAKVEGERNREEQ